MTNSPAYHLHRPSLTAIILLCVLVVSPLRIGQAQDLRNAGVDVSGHLDIRAVEGNASIGQNNFEIGQLMLDVTSDVTGEIHAAMELAYLSDASEVVVDEAYVDWTLFRWDGTPRQDPVGITDFGVIVGQFDVPFGLDWRSYRSIDRYPVSVPMVVANTHRGWNDVGLQVYAETDWANWSVYALNGFGTSQALRIGTYNEVSPQLISSDAATNASLNLTEAYGSRFGLNVNERVEFGTSFGSGYDDTNDQRTRMFGFDATVDYDELQLKGEFISRRLNLTDGTVTDLGYYVEGSYHWGRQFGVVRGDAYRPDEGPTDFATSLGGGYLVRKNAQLRVEYRWAQGSSNDTVLLQSAIAF